MSKLAYKVNFLSTQSESGSADRIVFTDELAILTVQAGHAPLISLLKKGKVVVSDADASKDYSYDSGLVRISDGQCIITLLK
jgi:F0F1-type ATP synthase epsilon subunit